MILNYPSFLSVVWQASTILRALSIVISLFPFTFRVKTIQNELGTQVLTDFEEALSVRGAKVHACSTRMCFALTR